MGPRACPEMSVRNYRYSPCNDVEDQSSYPSRCLQNTDRNPSKPWRQISFLLSSSGGIATRYGLDGPGSNPGGEGRDFPHLFRPSLWPTQPPVQWVPGLSWG